MTSLRRIFSLFSISLLLTQTFSPSKANGSEILIDNFKNGMRSGWKTEIFNGETAYTPSVIDGRSCIRAESKGTASGMIYEMKLDPEKYPILDWQWKVDNIIDKGDARSKAGDDYAARIYVVFPSFFFWKTNVLVYIWANKLPKGDSIRSSYSSNFIMIAVESGKSNLGKWLEYRENIYEDYRKSFGHTPPKAGAVAIMTDTDNTGESASACYGPIKFLSAE